MLSPSTMPRLSKEQATILNRLPGRLADVLHRTSFREPYTLRDEVLIVTKGLLSLYRDSGMGRRQIVSLRYPGEGIVPPELPPAFGVQALVPSQVLIVALEDFGFMVDKHPELQQLLRQRLERHAAISHEWLLNNSQKATVARVAHLLCETAVRASRELSADSITNPFTQSQIGDITGQTSVNVNRILSDMEEQGLIRRKGRTLEFLDWPELQRVAGFNPLYLQ